MAYYRLYVLDDRSGHFVGFEEIEAVDDPEAVRASGPHIGARALELWCGERKVRSFAAVETPDGD